MNTRTLRAHLKAGGWSQAELARRIGVSRQAVSLWFKHEQASLRGDHLMSIAKALGVSVQTLFEPLPAFGDDHDRLRTTFLWDRLYPELDDFAVAVNRWEPQAVARLVQVSGLYVAQRLLGRGVWKKFDSYKCHIHPARRTQLKGLIQWRNSPTCN